MGYIYVWECYGVGQHVDASWSSIFEDLYSLELDLRYLCGQCALLYIRFIRFFGFIHIFTVHLVSY